MTTAEHDIILLGDGGADSKIPTYKLTIPVNIYHFYIIGEIGEPNKYLDFINVLKTCEEHDTIFVAINSSGGDLDTTVQILSAMTQCVGNVVTSLEGQACSAASLIFLAGKTHIVNPHSTLMIHNYSCGAMGKGNEIASRIEYTQRYFRKLSYSMYENFLTEDEIESMLSGWDIWMDSDEVLERLALSEKKTEDSFPTKVEDAIVEVVEANKKKAPVKRNIRRKKT